MEKTPSKNIWTNFLILTATGTGAFVVAARGGSMAGLLAAIYSAVGILVTIISFMHMRHYRAEEQERLEVEQLKDRESSVAMFESDGDVLRAKRAREQFEKWFVPSWTILIMVAQGLAAFLLYQFFTRKDLVAPAEDAALLQCAFFSMFALAQYLFGKYSVGLARYENARILRPSGSYLMLASVVSVLTAVVSAATWFGYPHFDKHAAHGLSAILGLLALEMLVNLIMEIYRPRVQGREVHLLYESRLVGLLGQPGGIISTAAQTLDYQFGFKVSETWFYRYLERTLAWLVLLWVGVFLTSSCFVVLEPYEEALLERFGKPVEGRQILPPGIHVKLPWPIDKVHRYPTKAIQRFHIGYEPDPKLEEERVLVWTKNHYKFEYNMLVASRDVNLSTTSTNDTETVPVNLLTASIPVQYEITNLFQYARNHADAGTMLERLASQVVSRYLVSVDIEDIMAKGRIQAAGELRGLLQAEADRYELGTRIVFVGLQDIHPPVKVAKAYEDVIGSLQQRETLILNAEGFAAETVPMAGAQARQMVLSAEAEKISKVRGASAESGQFANQVSAFRASKEVYRRRTYLGTLVEAISGARKYVIGTTNAQDTYWLNLEDTIGDELNEVKFFDDADRQAQARPMGMDQANQ